MSVFRDLIRPDRWWPLLLVAFVGKLLLLLWMLLEHGTPLFGPWYGFGGDALGYLGPIDSLLQGKGYSPDYRMPGYGAPYLLLRAIMDRPAALQSLVVLQLAASACAVVVLAKLAHVLTDDLRAFRWTFWLALIATYASFYDRQILTESFSVLALTTSAYGGATFLKGAGRGRLLLTGGAITWLICMKPVYLPALAILAFAVILQRTVPLLRRTVAVAVLCAPFILVDGAWCTRNALVHGEFRPLTDGTIYPGLRASIRYPLMCLMQAYGTSFTWWDPAAEIRWFNIRYEEEGRTQFPDRQAPLPAYAYTTGCPEDSLKRIADEVALYNISTDTIEKVRLLSSVRGRCDRCIEYFRQEKPFHYQVTARLRLLRSFLVHSGTSALMAKPFAQLDPVRMLVRGFYSLLYLGAILGGTLWAVRSLFTRTAVPGLRLVSVLLLYGVCIFPLGMRMTEFRYSTAFYPLALLLAVLSAIASRDAFCGWRAAKRHEQRAIRA